MSKSELRIDPSTGIIWMKVAEADKTITVRPLGGYVHQTVTPMAWASWSRHEWPEGTP